ncbi:MAG: NAD(P)/FAD-dependent oxidoreductase [Ruminococcus sp.]|nr:NAD(P)/FAD-dependent oxidoreductase [Ruminococcus sp.]
MDKEKYTVIGGGISGLLITALLAAEGKQIDLIEKNTHCGGYLRNLGCGAPYGAHHIGLPDRGLLAGIIGGLGISDEGLLRSADTVRILSGQREYKLSLRLDEQCSQLCEIFPEEAEGLRAYFGFMTDFAEALYSDDDRQIKGYFVKLAGKSFRSFLEKYFSNEELIALLSFLGPSYGGVTDADSAFTFASLAATYGKGAYYMDCGALTEKLAEKAAGMENVNIMTGIQASRIRRDDESGRYTVYDGSGAVSEADKVIFAGSFRRILEEYCEHTGMNDTSFRKIFGMETGPSAYRYYFRTDVPLSRMEHIRLGADGYIMSTLESDECSVMLTCVTDSSQPQWDNERLISEISDTLCIGKELIHPVCVCSPSERENRTLNENGAVFGWKRNARNNLDANLIYSIDKKLPGIYVTGNWSATFGFFGCLYTANKLFCKLTADRRS